MREGERSFQDMRSYRGAGLSDVLSTGSLGLVDWTEVVPVNGTLQTQ